MKTAKRWITFYAHMVAVLLTSILPLVLVTCSSAQAGQPTVAAGGLSDPHGTYTDERGHTVGLKTDGTVVVAGGPTDLATEVGSWTNIVQVAGGGSGAVGLKSDGTVVVKYGYGVDSWTDIVQVASSVFHIVGLKSDGTVVAVGPIDEADFLNVSSWTNIVQVAAGGGNPDHDGDPCTLGLKSDGTVMAVGGKEMDFGKLNVSSWTNIVQVAAGGYHNVGLKSDGTVVAVGANGSGQLDVGSWTDIVQLAAGLWHTVGLKSDGTVVAVGNNSRGQLSVGSWTDIVKVTAGPRHTVGLKKDGSVVAVGDNDSGQCNTFDWDLIPDYTLTIQKSAKGSGTISGSGISCGSDCEEVFAYGTVVTLTASANTDSIFISWTGCDSVSGNTCTVTMNANVGITAQFVLEDTKEYTLKVKKTKKNKGDGVVTSKDGKLSCGSTCSSPYYQDTVVTLSAIAHEGSTFIGWNSDTCIGTDPCIVPIDQAKTIQAIFVGDYALKVTAQGKKGGSGLVSSTPSGISCATGSKAGCIATYPYGEPVVLSASPNTGSTFLGWSPTYLCSGTEVCFVPMDKKRSLKAVFRYRGE